MQEMIRYPQTPGQVIKTVLFDKKKAVFTNIPEIRVRQFTKTMKTPISFSPRALHCYMAACKWVADMDFYSRESVFFRLLIENYTLTAVDAEHLGRLDNALHRLSEQTLEIGALQKSLADHLQKLILIGKKKTTEDPEWLADAHVSFDALMSTFTIEYRNEKLAFFDLIEEFLI